MSSIPTDSPGKPQGLPAEWAPAPSPQAAQKDKLAQVLGEATTAGVQPGNKLSFSARAKAKLRSMTERRYEAKKIGGKGILAAKLKSFSKHTKMVESLDVRGLNQKEFQETRNMMQSYHNLRVGAGQMMQNKPIDTAYGWTPLPSGKAEEQKDLPLAALEAFGKLTATLTECGFTPAGDDDKTFYHEATGTNFAVMYNKDQKELSLFFFGLGNSPKDKGFFTRLGQVVAESLGAKTKSTELCLKLGKALKMLAEEQSKKDAISDQPTIKFSTSGHSHGGNLAQIVALTAGLKGVLFNSRCISGKTQELIKHANPNFDQNKNQLTHFNKHGCWVTDNPTLNALAKVYGKITGKSAAARIGREHYVPSTRKGAAQCHNETHWPAELTAHVSSRRQSLGSNQLPANYA